MIQPGELRENIIVSTITTIKDNYGATEDIYTDRLYLKAKVKYVSGNKIINNNEIFNSEYIYFTTHFRNINKSDRIDWQDNTYEINFLLEIGFHEGLEIRCKLLND